MTRILFPALAALLLLLCQCYQIRPSNGGGQIKGKPGARLQSLPNPANIALPRGYRIEAVAHGLTFPTGITFDEQGHPYVTEAGYSYGEVRTTARLLRINPDGSTTEIANGGENGPWTGVSYHAGNFYVAEARAPGGGRILRITPNGNISTLIGGLPGQGDHHTNSPLIHNGYLYFGQGSATNSGVVGNDNANYGWLRTNPGFHDSPCGDLLLRGNNYSSDNVLSPQKGDKVVTGAFLPYGQASMPNQLIKGIIPCTGSIMRMPVQGGELEVVAWGLRNPFGLAFSPDGRLYATENGYDDRGSRPVWGAGDVLWEISPGLWYGWPDFSAGQPLYKKDDFKIPRRGHQKPEPLLATYPNLPPQPAAVLGVHASANGLDFSHSEAFGYPGQAFIAEFGDLAPTGGKVLAPVGFKVVRVDVQNGIIEDFAVNRGKRNGPASYQGKGGLERPIALRFNPAGDALYVVDFGIMQIINKEPVPLQNTGVIWKITKR